MPSEQKLHVQVANPELATGFLLYLMHLSMSSPKKGGGAGKPGEFDCDLYSQGEDFDRTSCI